MDKSIKYMLAVIWIIATRSYDAYFTYQLTPDLSAEANPLVSILGLTWTPLFIVLGLLTIYSAYAHYLSTFRPINLLPSERGYSFSNIIAYTYLGRKDEWYSIFYKLPTDLRRFNQYMGQLLTSCLIYAGIVSSIMWLLINHSEYYQNIHSAHLIYTILIVGSLTIIYYWNKSKYNEYLAVSQSEHK